MLKPASSFQRGQGGGGGWASCAGMWVRGCKAAACCLTQRCRFPGRAVACPQLSAAAAAQRDEAAAAVEPWLGRFDAVLVGPGLGRDPLVLATVAQVRVDVVVKGRWGRVWPAALHLSQHTRPTARREHRVAAAPSHCPLAIKPTPRALLHLLQVMREVRHLGLPMVVDADGLWLVNQEPSLVAGGCRWQQRCAAPCCPLSRFLPRAPAFVPPLLLEACWRLGGCRLAHPSHGCLCPHMRSPPAHPCRLCQRGADPQQSRIPAPGRQTGCAGRCARRAAAHLPAVRKRA